MWTNFTEWWDLLPIFEKIYYSIALPSTLIFIVQIGMLVLGFDSDHGDGDTDTDHEIGHEDASFHFFTLRNIIAFFMIFGWSGPAFLERLGSNYLLTIIISFVLGIIIMIIMAAIFYLMSKLSYSGTLQMENAIGKTGNVYLPIPARRAGVGKVQIKVQGAVRTLDAMTEELEDIKSGSIVEVLEIINQNILIVRQSR